MPTTSAESFRLGDLRDADGREVVTASGGVADTVLASGSAAAPGVAAVLAQLTGLVQGAVYDVVATVVLTGSAETALRNIELRNNATQLGLLPTLTGAGQFTLRVPRLTTTGTTVDLRAVAAAVAGSVYNVVLAATRVE